MLDASAILATIQREKGFEQVDAVLTQATVSAVNYSEVIAKLADRGMPEAPITLLLDRLNLNVSVFTEQQAQRAGQLRALTRKAGLSLGDRACLALAEELGCPVVTADRAWAELDLGVPVVLIR